MRLDPYPMPWENKDMVSSGDFQPFQTTRVLTGRIDEWNDAKGFGWTEVEGKRVFVHVKEFEPGQRRPRKGEEIRFILASDSQGRPRAGKVSFVKSGGRVSLGAWMLWGALLVLPGLALLFLPWSRWGLPSVALVVSAITYGMYADDKKRAINGEWRIPESWLHLCELLGGWPGAFLAQKRLRHKCSKILYQIGFWLIVFLHQAVAMDVIAKHEISRALWKVLVQR